MPREELYLQDIIQAADAVRRFLDGVEQEKFLNDEILQNAVLLKLIVIGEAAARISDELRNRHSGIEWKAMIGFRNIVVHAYFSVNWDIVWETASAQLTPLQKQISEILQTDFPDFELKSNS
jgi:uncharacterized protein with HEPN domain